MTDTNNPPRMPKIGEKIRMLGELVRIDEPAPVQPPTEYIFKVVGADLELWLNGIPIKSLTSYNDFYGSAVETAIEEAKKYCERQKITAESDLEVVVFETTGHIRSYPDPGNAFIYDKEFVRFTGANKYRPNREPVPSSTKRRAWSSRAQREEVEGDEDE